jgi:hypothetical protein
MKLRSTGLFVGPNQAFLDQLGLGVSSDLTIVSWKRSVVQPLLLAMLTETYPDFSAILIRMIWSLDSSNGTVEMYSLFKIAQPVPKTEILPTALNTSSLLQIFVYLSIGFLG